MHYDNFKISRQEQQFLKTMRNLCRLENELGNKEVPYNEFIEDINDYYWDLVQTVRETQNGKL